MTLQAAAPTTPNRPHRTGTCSSLRTEILRQLHEHKRRQRDVAEQLGLSEAELLAQFVGEDGPLRVRRLEAERAPEILQGLADCGDLMALTRNEAAVHERTGRYVNASHNAHVGLVLGEEIDLRLFYRHWKHAFWVEEQSPGNPAKLSLQFFDAHGQAVHKIFERQLTDRSRLLAWSESFLATEQQAGWLPAAPEPDQAEVSSGEPPSEETLSEFLKQWGELQDTHDFHPLLRRFGLSRTRAMQAADGRFTRCLPNRVARELLEKAAARKLEIMIFVGNRGCIQIHTGPVHHIKVLGSWLNVLDPRFNLHLHEDLIAQSWFVQKPTRDGIVSSIELYDAHADTIVQFFGKRKPGQAEQEAWRKLCAELLRLS